VKTITLNSFRAPLSNEVLLDIWDRKVESQNSACERPTRPSSLFPPPSYHGDHSNHASAGRFSIKGSRVSALCIRRFLSCKIHKICAFCREFATIFWRIVAKLCELKVEIVLKAGGWPLTSTLNDGVVQAVTFGHLTDWLISFCQNSSTSWFARKFAMDISHRFPPTAPAIMLPHYLLWKSEIPKNVTGTDFDSILNKLLTCSWGHFEDLI